jgi:X-X-X-Leu-X-X-Gly heptad repeat protein
MKHVRFVTIQSETLPQTASSLEIAQKAVIAVSCATALSTLATAFNTLANGLNTLANKEP